MNSDNEAKTYYDEFSERYDQGRHQGYHALIDELEIRSIKPYLAGSKVLEAGCGTGLILERLEKAGTHSVTGFDMSEGMLQKATSRGFPVICASVTEIPFSNDTFDVTCSFKVLPHVPNIGRALSELVRVTKPGGIIAAEFYNPWSVRFLSKWFAGPQPIGKLRNEADIHTRWDSPLSIKRYLPPNVHWIKSHGIRVVTPLAKAFHVPGIREILRRSEEALFDSSLWHFGGFLVVILQKHSID